MNPNSFEALIKHHYHIFISSYHTKQDKQFEIWIPLNFHVFSLKNKVKQPTWWQLKDLLFSSLFGEDSLFDVHIFQMGGSTTNQQLGNTFFQKARPSALVFSAAGFDHGTVLPAATALGPRVRDSWEVSGGLGDLTNRPPKGAPQKVANGYTQEDLLLNLRIRYPLVQGKSSEPKPSWLQVRDVNLSGGW